jgi:endonuclease YncB( thermonuclease family)
MVVVFARMHNMSLAPARLAGVLAAMIGWAAALPAAAEEAPPADLPTVDVGTRPVHVVPDQEPPPPPTVTLRDREGNSVAWHVPPAVRRPSSAAMPSPLLVSGEARLAEGLSLSLRGRALPLFGVRLPAAGDRCAVAGTGAVRPCDEAAREALAGRLRINDKVTCHVPPGQRGLPAAVCEDANGVDLGGFLVGQGLALADLTQSYEYVETESVARASRRGLWNR